MTLPDAASARAAGASLFADNPFLQLELHRLRRHAWRALAWQAGYVTALAAALLLPLWLAAPEERGMYAMAAVSWSNLIILWAVFSRQESFAEDAAKQRLQFLLITPQTALQMVVRRSIAPALRRLGLVVLSLPFYALCWQFVDVSGRALIVMLGLIILASLTAGAVHPPNVWWLFWVAQISRLAPRLRAGLMSNLLLFPLVAADWISRPQSWYADRLNPLPWILAWHLWRTLNTMYAQSVALDARTTTVPAWLQRARTPIGVLIAVLVMGFVWSGWIGNGLAPSLWQAPASTPLAAIGGLLVLWLLLAGKPRTMGGETSSSASEAVDDEDEHDVSASERRDRRMTEANLQKVQQPPAEPPPPVSFFARRAVTKWVRGYGLALGMFAAMLALAGAPLPSARVLLIAVLLSVVDVTCVQCRSWRAAQTAGRSVPGIVEHPLMLWVFARSVAPALALVQPLGAPPELVLFSPLLSLVALSPFAPAWDAKFEWLQIPASALLPLAAILPLLAEVVDVAGVLLGVRKSKPLEVKEFTPSPPVEIRWRNSERRWLTRADNPIFAFHYERWRRNTPELPARWVRRVGGALIAIPVLFAPWMAPTQWAPSPLGDYRVAASIGAMVGVGLCFIFAASPAGTMGDRMWKERASGFIEQILVLPLAERHIVCGWLWAALTGIYLTCAPIVVAVVALTLMARAGPLFSGVVALSLLSLPMIGALLLLTDASAAWSSSAVDLSKQTHATGIFQFLCFGLLFFSVAASLSPVFLSVVAGGCAIGWLLVPPLLWWTVRRFRKLRRRWGETHAGRAP